jgi:hypothetical protein
MHRYERAEDILSAFQKIALQDQPGHGRDRQGFRRPSIVRPLVSGIVLCARRSFVVSTVTIRGIQRIIARSRRANGVPAIGVVVWSTAPVPVQGVLQWRRRGGERYQGPRRPQRIWSSHRLQDHRLWYRFRSHCPMVRMVTLILLLAR